MRRILRQFGLEVCRLSFPGSGGLTVRRDSLHGLLEHMRGLGFSPGSVFDAGAACGTFSSQCHAISPDVHYLLMEP